MKATREKVFAAADAILEDGSTPSAISIRKAIGGGSYETIQNHLEEWREIQAVKAAASAEPMPAPIAEVIRLFGNQLWQRARDGANDRLVAERKAMDSERAELEASRREAMQAADQLTAELDQVREERLTLQQSVAMAQADIESLRQQLAEANARHAGDEERHRTLQCQLEAARDAEALARDHAGAQRGRLEALEAQNADLLARL